jgi:hypothetical protein
MLRETEPKHLHPPDTVRFLTYSTIQQLDIWDLAVCMLWGLHENGHSTADVHVAAKQPAAA